MKEDKKIFVSIIWGYPPHFYRLVKEENPYLHILDVALKMGFSVKIIATADEETFTSDPNFDKKIEIIKYKTFLNYILNIIKFSLKNSIFYVNSLEWQSFIVPFLAKRTIFMAHTQPKRQTRNKQIIQKVVFNFFKAIRLNNEDEKDFLLKDGCSEKKLFVVPLVVAQDIFKVTNYNQIRHNLVYFGNVTKKKNVITILRAFEAVRMRNITIKLNIIGIVYDDDVKKFVEKSKFKEDIIFYGFLEYNDLVSELNSNLIYLNSSFDEGQCVAVYDAALCGCVLCLSNIMSFTGVFKDKALFHDVYDYNKLANNIINYLTNENLIVENRKRVIDMIKINYSNEAVENGLRNLINNI